MLEGRLQNINSQLPVNNNYYNPFSAEYNASVYCPDWIFLVVFGKHEYNLINILYSLAVEGILICFR